MGGASATAGDENPDLFSRLHEAARRRFPSLDGVEWQYGWSGYLGLTHDHLPQVQKSAPGFLAAIACNGRGIAMATITGRQLAEIVLNDSERDCDLPIRKAKRVFGFALRHPGVRAAVFFNRLLDRVDRSRS